MINIHYNFLYDEHYDSKECCMLVQVLVVPVPNVEKCLVYMAVLSVHLMRTMLRPGSSINAIRSQIADHWRHSTEYATEQTTVDLS